MFFRVFHEAVGVWPRGHVVQSEAHPGIDFDRLVRLGAVTPISDAEATHLVATGQSPPPNVLPPLPERGSEAEMLHQFAKAISLAAAGSVPPAGPGPQGPQTAAHGTAPPHPGDSAPAGPGSPHGPATAPHGAPGPASPAGGTPAAPLPPATVTTGADHPPLTETVDPKPSASAEGGKAGKKADADKAK